MALGAVVAWVVLVEMRRTGPVVVKDDLPTSTGTVVDGTLFADHVQSVAGWITTVTVALLVGSVAFQMMARSVLAGRQLAGSYLWPMFGTAGLVAAAAALPLRTAALYGGPVTWDPTMLQRVLESRFGAAMLLRMSGILIVLAGLPTRSRSGRQPTTWWIGGTVSTLGAGLMVGSYCLVGHPQATQPAVVNTAAQAVHILVVSIWFGGVVLLGAEMRRSRLSNLQLAGLVTRFSLLAASSVVAAAVTGVILARSQVTSVEALQTTPYGRALLVKLLALALPLLLGAYNHLRLVPAIRADRNTEVATRRLRRTVRVEAVVLALGVMVATAAMVSGGF